MGFDFIVIVLLLSSHCGFSFVSGCGVCFFGEFQCLPVDDCSAVSCDSGVLARWSESTSFYSSILNQSVACFFIHPDNLFLFIEMFRPFLKIIDMVVIKCIKYYLFSPCPICILFSFSYISGFFLV